MSAPKRKPARGAARPALPVYHYTTLYKAMSIVDDGAIELATKGIPAGERPAVWCTTSPTYERTAIKVPLGTPHDVAIAMMVRAHGGLVRFRIDPALAPYTWADFRRMSGIDPRLAAGLVRGAIQVRSNPEHWRVSFEPVTSWLAVEFSNDGVAWTVLDLDSKERAAS